MSETKQINKPNTDDQPNEALTNKIDTGQVDGEEDSIDRHEFAITPSVKKVASNRPREKIDNSTK